MARQVILTFDGETSAFDIARLDRSKLYGSRRRVVVDDDGQECLRGLLSEDGSVLLPPGCTADLYVDDSFDVVERSDLKAVDAEGQPLTPVASTLGVPMPLTGPIALTRVLDHVTPTIYLLDPADLSPKLQAALAAGSVFESRFAYRDGFDDQTLFLLQNEVGVFALVGRPTNFEYVRRASPPPEADEDEDLFEDDLDFGMM